MEQYATYYPQPDLTVREACTMLNVSPPTVYKMLAEGQLVSYKVGKCRRIKRESFEALRNTK